MIIAANTTLLRLVETWTTLETSIGAVSRLKSIDETTPSEEVLESLEPEASWPSQGAIEVDGVTASYGYVLVLIRILDPLSSYSSSKTSANLDLERR